MAAECALGTDDGRSAIEGECSSILIPKLASVARPLRQLNESLAHFLPKRSVSGPRGRESTRDVPPSQLRDRSSEPRLDFVLGYGQGGGRAGAQPSTANRGDVPPSQLRDRSSEPRLDFVLGYGKET